MTSGVLSQQPFTLVQRLLYFVRKIATYQIYLEIRSARFRILLSSLNIKLGIITFQSILNNCISEFRRSVLYKVLIYNKLRRSFV